MAGNSQEKGLFLGEQTFHRKFMISNQTLLAKHLLILGQTGAGKSTSAKQLVNQLQETNQINVIFDPTGEYDRDLNNQITYRLAENASIDLSAQSAEELLQVLGLNWDSQLTAKLQAAITSLRIQENRRMQPMAPLVKVNLAVKDYEQLEQELLIRNQRYAMQLLPKQLVQEFVRPFSDERANYEVLGQEIDHETVSRYWSQIQELDQLLKSERLNRIFLFSSISSKHTRYDLSFILRTFEERPSQHRSLIVDLAELQPYPAIQQRVISFLMEQLLQNRLSSDVRLPVIIFLDEAHRYLPVDQPINENGLFHILREGRKVNLNLVLSTQSLQDLPQAIRGQFASLLIHRYQSIEDLAGIPLTKRFVKRLPQLSVGQAVLLTSAGKTYFLKIHQAIVEQ